MGRGCLLSLLAVLFGAAAFAGCGGPPSSSKADDSAAGTSGEKQTATNDAPPKPRDARTIDLRTLPQAEQTKFTIYAADRLEGTARGTAAEILARYRTALEKLGWKISSPPSKDQTAEESASALLENGNDAIFLSVSPSIAGRGKPATDEKLLSLGNLGDCDSSKLPRLPGAEKGYGSRLSSVYFTDMKAAATAASVKNLLLHDGWQPFTKPYAIKSESLNSVRDEYRKQGNSLKRARSGPPPAIEKAPLVGQVRHWARSGTNCRRHPTRPMWSSTTHSARCNARCPASLQSPSPNTTGDTLSELGYEAPREIPADDTRLIVKFRVTSAGGRSSLN